MKASTEKKHSTTALLNKIKSSHDLGEFLSDHAHEFTLPPFSQVITNLCSQNGLIPEQVIRRSGIERTYGHQLFNGTRKPSRDKVIQLAFGLGLNGEQTQELLKSACKSQLYPKIKRDAAILFCLEHHQDIFETQSVLQSLDLSLLGEEISHD